LISDYQIGKRKIGIGSRLFLLLNIMLIPFILFFMFRAYDIQSRLEREAQAQSMQIAKAVAEDIDEFINSTGDLVLAISKNDTVKAQDYAKAGAWLSDIIDAYPYYANIMIVESNGDLKVVARASGMTGKPPLLSVKDTANYKLAMEADGMAIGDIFNCRLSDKPVVHIMYPTWDNNGERIGYVAVVLDLEKIQNKVIRTAVPEGSTINVVNQKGIMVAHNIDSETWVGKDISEADGFKEMIGKKEGTGKEAGPEGESRIFGFVQANKVPWYVCVGISGAYIQGLVRDQLYQHLAVFIPLVLIAILGWFWISKDVRRLHAETERLSLTDAMTGLRNFRSLNKALDEEINRAKRYSTPFSLILLDIDHFKEYNDNNGHQKGDEALFIIARVIEYSIRDIDTAYRYGGEEMCVLLPGTELTGAIEVAERIRKNVEEATFDGEANQPLGKLTVSLGVANYPKHSTTKKELLKKSDEALYAAKEKGRNCVIIAGDQTEPLHKAI